MRGYWREAFIDAFFSLMLLGPMAAIMTQAFFLAYEYRRAATVNTQIAEVYTRVLTKGE